MGISSNWEDWVGPPQVWQEPTAWLLDYKKFTNMGNSVLNHELYNKNLQYTFLSSSLRSSAVSALITGHSHIHPLSITLQVLTILSQAKHRGNVSGHLYPIYIMLYCKVNVAFLGFVISKFLEDIFTSMTRFDYHHNSCTMATVAHTSSVVHIST